MKKKTNDNIDLSKLKVALVHDWLIGMRGGEKVFEVFCEIFPQADVRTLIYEPEKVSDTIRKMNIIPSGLSKYSMIRKKHRYFLPFYPHIIDGWEFDKYDLILSSSHCVAKGARPGKKTKHICYCFTPMRYIWDMYDQYFNRNGHRGLASIGMKFFRKGLQKWDVKSAERVHNFIGCSKHVVERINRHYNRESDVVYPPVDCDLYFPDAEKQDFYLMVTALVPYKRADLAIEAFSKMNKPLKIVGSGPQLEELKAKSPKNIEYLGWASDEEIRKLYSSCRAFIFPGEEDFGITPVEAAACGSPTIAFNKGGVTESMVGLNAKEPPTALFFDKQTPESLIEAVNKFEEIESKFTVENLRNRALKFSRQEFKRQMTEYIIEKIKECNFA